MQEIPTHVDDPGREKATLEEAPVDAASDLSTETGSSSLFSKRRISGASSSSELSLPGTGVKQRTAKSGTSAVANVKPLWTCPPELPDELVRLTPFPVYSADALSVESRAPIGELPLFFYWYRRAVYPVRTTGTRSTPVLVLI